MPNYIFYGNDNSNPSSILKCMKKLALATTIPEKPSFHGFQIDQIGFVPGYRRNMPHLRLQGATYFVTFRLADSLPEATVKKWIEERHQWLIRHEVTPELFKSNPTPLV